MTRFYFHLGHVDQWYQIMRECRAWFGNNWRSQPRVRRRLTKLHPHMGATDIWFEVPDQRFATWISVKMAVQVRTKNTDQAAK